MTTDIQAVMDCISRTVLLTWRLAYGAVAYNATVRSASGSVTCHTNATTCELDVVCGESYSVSVVTLGVTCNSDPAHMSGALTTGEQRYYILYIYMYVFISFTVGTAV